MDDTDGYASNQHNSADDQGYEYFEKPPAFVFGSRQLSGQVGVFILVKLHHHGAFRESLIVTQSFTL